MAAGMRADASDGEGGVLTSFKVCRPSLTQKRQMAMCLDTCHLLVNVRRFQFLPKLSEASGLNIDMTSQFASMS